MKEYTASVEKYARAASAYRTALLRSNEDRRRHLLGEGRAVMRYAEAKIQRDEALKLLATRVEASRLDEAQAPLRAMSERVQRLEDALRGMRCPSCTGTGTMTGTCLDPHCGESYWDHERGHDINVTCTKCNGTGLHPSARAALEEK